MAAPNFSRPMIKFIFFSLIESQKKVSVTNFFERVKSFFRFRLTELFGNWSKTLIAVLISTDIFHPDKKPSRLWSRVWKRKLSGKKVRLLVRKFGGGDSNEVQSNLSVKNCISHFFVLRLFYFSLRPCWSFTLACSHPLTLLQMSSVIGAKTCRRCFRELSPSMTFFQVLAIFLARGFQKYF